MQLPIAELWQKVLENVTKKAMQALLASNPTQDLAGLPLATGREATYSASLRRQKRQGYYRDEEVGTTISPCLSQRRS